ncbi:glycosyltransferase family 4 protein [Buchananella felis]|uniref:glycosyltransferase family 4 protein n=1 Tax=Buchananella felis TaxID=3231492 RepID=UPI0035289E83
MNPNDPGVSLTGAEAGALHEAGASSPGPVSGWARPDGRPHVLVVTTWLPTPAHPVMGSFVQRDIAALAAVADVRVVHLCRPSLLAGAPARDSIAAGERRVPVERIAFEPGRPWRWGAARRRLRALASACDVVHTMAFSSALPFLARRPGKRWVHTEHWSLFVQPATGWRRRLPGLAARLLRRPDATVGVSAFLAGRLEELTGRPVVAVPNIVDVPPPAPRTPVGARGRADGSLRLMGVGGLVPGKRPLLAVEVTAELRRRGVAADLTWFGDGELRAEVEELASRLGVPLTLTGFVPHGELRQRYRDFDLFLGTTAFETFYLGAAEALASGRPVVAGGEGGHAAFVLPPAGRIVAGQDPAAFADAVQAVLADCDELSAQEIGAELRRDYSAAALARAYLALYRG